MLELRSFYLFWESPLWTISSLIISLFTGLVNRFRGSPGKDGTEQMVPVQKPGSTQKRRLKNTVQCLWLCSATCLSVTDAQLFGRAFHCTLGLEIPPVLASLPSQVRIREQDGRFYSLSAAAVWWLIPFLCPVLPLAPSGSACVMGLTKCVTYWITKMPQTTPASLH